jgi:hypothetical protein
MSQSRVEFEGFAGSGIRLGKILVRIAPVIGEDGIGISETGIGISIFRVPFDRLIEKGDRGVQFGVVPQVPLVTTL